MRTQLTRNLRASALRQTPKHLAVAESVITGSNKRRGLLMMLTNVFAFYIRDEINSYFGLNKNLEVT